MELAYRNRRLKEYAPLVERLAYRMKRMLPGNIEVDDLIQAGMLGLMGSANRYNELRGVQFGTYAMKRIRGAMLDELRHDDWVPQALRRAMRRLDAATMKLQHLLGRPPNEMEIAKELDIPLAAFQKMRFESQGAQLLYYEEEGREDFLDRHGSDISTDPFRLLQGKYFHQALANAISRLSKREYRLMDMRYQQGMNLCEIGKKMGFNESRACQIHKRVVEVIRTSLKEYLTGTSEEDYLICVFSH